MFNPSKESLDTLQQKHSQAPPDLMLPPSTSATTPPTYFSQNQIKAAISSFPHGSGTGPEGLRPQHLKDCISILAGDASTSLLTSLTELVNHLTNGHLTTALQPFLYGAQPGFFLRFRFGDRKEISRDRLEEFERPFSIDVISGHYILRDRFGPSKHLKKNTVHNYTDCAKTMET